MAGNLDFLKSQLFGSVPMPTQDLSGRTIVLTGANSGLGLDCAKHLVRLNVSRLVIACRSEAKGESAKKEILAAAGTKSKSKIEALTLEMSSYASVLAFAERCKAFDQLDGVVLNAGVGMNEYAHVEDNETTITVNVIATTLLAVLLLPKLQESASRSSIVPHLTIVGSFVHYIADPKQLSGFAEGQMLKSLDDPREFGDRNRRYSLSKLLVMFIVRELAEKVSAGQEHGKPLVVVNCVAPGWCKTPLFRDGVGNAGLTMGLKVLGRSSEEGSRTLAHAVAAGSETHGQYLSECKVKPSSPFVRSREGASLQKRVWKEMLEEMEKIKPGCAGGI